MEKKNLLESKIGLKLSTIGKKSKVFALQRFSKHKHPITPEQFSLLAALTDHDGMSQTQLAASTMKDKPNITRLTNILEGMGLVTRKADVDRRKIYKIFITEKGRQVYNKILPTILDIWRDTVEGISDDELEVIVKVLSKIRLNLDKYLDI